MAQPIHQPEDEEFGGQIEPKYSDLPHRLTEQVPAEASGIFQGLGIKGGGTVRGSAAVTLHLVATASVVLAGLIWTSNAAAGAATLMAIILLVVIYVISTRPSQR